MYAVGYNENDTLGGSKLSWYSHDRLCISPGCQIADMINLPRRRSLMENKSPLLRISPEAGLALRGIAILLVLLGHTGYIVMGGAGGVALFLMLSGFGLNLSCEKSGLRFYWNKRIRKVWLPAMIVGAFNILTMGVRSWPHRLTMLLGFDLGLNLDKTMWYVSFILVWYLVYYVLALICSPLKKSGLRRAMMLVGLVGAGFLFRRLCALGLWSPASLAIFYIWFFPLGVVLSFLSRLKVHENLRLLFWMALLFLSTVFMFRVYTQEASAPLALGMAMQVLSLSQLMDFRGKVLSLLSWFGRYAYPIYLFEGTLLLLKNTWFASFGSQLMIDLVYIAVSCGFAFVFWEAAYSRLEKMLPLDKIIRF